MRLRQYIVVTLLATAVLVPAGYAWVHWNKSGPGTGLYSRDWKPEAVQAYWDQGRAVHRVPRRRDARHCQGLAGKRPRQTRHGKGTGTVPGLPWQQSPVVAHADTEGLRHLSRKPLH